MDGDEVVVDVGECVPAGARRLRFLEAVLARHRAAFPAGSHRR